MNTTPLVAIVLAIAAPGYAEPLSRTGLSFTAGGGLFTFMGAEMRTFATNGAGWEGRIGVRTKRMWSLEAVYVGSLHSIDVPGMKGPSYLVGTGAELDLRINARYGGVEPYILSGLGWTQLRLTRTSDGMSVLRERDNIGQIPLGLGVGFHHGHAVVDLRATYRFTGFVGLYDSIDDGLESWSFALAAGFEL